MSARPIGWASLDEEAREGIDGKVDKQRQFKPDGTFYAPNEPREKMKKMYRMD